MLTGLSLYHYRNYTSQTFLFSKPLTLIYAPNATGKSNVLEALHLLSTGQSFRAGTIDDFIQVGQEYGRIKAKAIKENETSEIELVLTHGLLNGKRVQKKSFSVNQVKKRLPSILGLLPMVAFIPEDLRLITGSPSRRREFLDTTLIQIDRDYTHALKTYQQTLTRRNKLLQQIREGETPRTTLSFWTQSLLKHGEYLQQARRKFIDKLNSIEFPLNFHVDYDLSLISPERLAKYSEAEIAAGHTLVGPHKDDIEVKFQISNSKLQNSSTHNHVNLKHKTQQQDGNGQVLKLNTSPPFVGQADFELLSTHGSRGQQRMGVLWLKLGAFSIILEKTGQAPILLLDDIFSELDRENRQRVLELAQQTQTIMTTAEEEVMLLPELQHAEIIQL